MNKPKKPFQQKPFQKKKQNNTPLKFEITPEKFTIGVIDPHLIVIHRLHPSYPFTTFAELHFRKKVKQKAETRRCLF